MGYEVLAAAALSCTFFYVFTTRTTEENMRWFFMALGFIFAAASFGFVILPTTVELATALMFVLSLIFVIFIALFFLFPLVNNMRVS